MGGLLRVGEGGTPRTKKRGIIFGVLNFDAFFLLRLKKNTFLNLVSFLIMLQNQTVGINSPPIINIPCKYRGWKIFF